MVPTVHDTKHPLYQQSWVPDVHGANNHIFRNIWVRSPKIGCVQSKDLGEQLKDLGKEPKDLGGQPKYLVVHS